MSETNVKTTLRKLTNSIETVAMHKYNTSGHIHRRKIIEMINIHNVLCKLKS